MSFNKYYRCYFNTDAVNGSIHCIYLDVSLLIFQGAFYGIILGHICGACRFIIELIHPAPPCGEEDTRPLFLSKFHYTYYVQLQLLFTAISIMIISMFTRARTEEEVSNKHG